MLVGYSRVSTPDQTPELQIDALNAEGCERIFSDVASGAKTDRPGLDDAISYCREGDRWWSGNWIGWDARCPT